MANLQTVNIFFRAKTPEEIVRLQLINNQINSAQFSYQTPVWTGKDWVCWFFADTKSWNDPRKVKEEALKFARGLNND